MVMAGGQASVTPPVEVAVLEEYLVNSTNFNSDLRCGHVSAAQRTWATRSCVGGRTRGRRNIERVASASARNRLTSRSFTRCSASERAGVRAGPLLESYLVVEAASRAPHIVGVLGGFHMLSLLPARLRVPPDDLQLAADTDVNLVITAGSSGDALRIATAVHRRSRRSQQPLVTLRFGATTLPSGWDLAWAAACASNADDRGYGTGAAPRTRVAVGPTPGRVHVRCSKGARVCRRRRHIAHARSAG
jgi:hypothetical protein